MSIVDDIRIYQNFGDKAKSKEERIKDWIFEADENGQYIRPWAQIGHPEYEYALFQTELVMEYFKSKGKDLDLDTILAWTDKIMSDNKLKTGWLLDECLTVQEDIRQMTGGELKESHGESAKFREKLEQRGKLIASCISGSEKVVAKRLRSNWHEPSLDELIKYYKERGNSSIVAWLESRR